MTSPIHFGIQLHPQYVSWDEMREFGLLVDELGYDSLMTWDHFVPLYGDPTGPNLEGWQVLAAWAAITTNAKIAMLVTGNTYRHPAVLANMVATLDHITNGRAILGLGAAWHEGEHTMYGLPFFTTGGRLARMDEAAALIRELLDRPFSDFQGKHYRMRNATCEPKPVQQRLPILIGGAGEQKTLRTVAKYADLWHTNATPDVFAHKIGVLRRHCAEVKRDPNEIAPIATERPWVCLRESEAEVRAWAKKVATANGMSAVPELQHVSVDALVARLVEYWKVGVRGFIFYTLAPFDRETIERVAREVRPRFLEAIA